MAFFEVQYTNKAGVPTHVTKWTNHAYSIAAKEGAGEPAFWSYQSGSYEKRPDWVLPLKAGFQAGKLPRDELDGLRRRNPGLGCLEPRRGHRRRTSGGVPKLVSLPVTMPDASARRWRSHSNRSSAANRAHRSKPFRPSWRCTKATIFRRLKDYSAAMLTAA